MGEIVMPRLSDTMEEGTILSWLVADGEQVKRGQELVEIETDKANMTYESDQEGILETVAAEGDTLPVGAVIAHIGAGDPGTSVSTAAKATTKTDDEPASRPADVHTVDEATESDVSPLAPSSPAALGAGETQGSERLRASPLARRIARENEIDLHTVTGSGPGGRIVKADVQGAAAGPAATAGAPPAAGAPSAADATSTAGAGTPSPDAAGVAAPPAATPGAGGPSPGAGASSPSAAGLADVTTAKGETTTVDLTRTQQTIARRMAESKATIPHFALQSDVDMEACVALRTELKKLAPQPHAPAGAASAASTPSEASEATPTYNDMVVKASALALREEPRANSSYRDGKLQMHARVNVGVAVAVESDEPTGGALIVPTVFDADTKSLGEIARETRALATKVREGTITPPELGGGTFTVSNLGMFGVSSFTAIVNPPQAAILSVGTLAPRAVVRDGEVVVRNTMTITLACDHRILYGADAARFLARVRELLEAPAALTL
ncbi:MAG TPA: dihydrolipoamide acetyltransferase family protein [Solirubrobacteraceae bacterium]